MASFPKAPVIIAAALLILPESHQIGTGAGMNGNLLIIAAAQARHHRHHQYVPPPPGNRWRNALVAPVDQPMSAKSAPT
jgi:hypothetical protein